VPALELSGCAERESLVPAYIDRLQAMTGVTDVAFSRSERLEKGGETGSGSDSSGDCRNGDSRTARFALVTYFKAGASQAAATAAAATPDTSAAPAAKAPAASGPAAQPQTNRTTAPSTQRASTAIGGSR
jgi:hypothetical protein